MYTLADTAGRKTAVVALRNSIYLIPLGFLAYDWGVTSGWFVLESTALTLAISAAAFSFYRDRTKERARRMFHASLLYLPIFMAGLLIHRRTDNKQFLEVNAEGFVKSSYSVESSDTDDENGNQKIKGRQGNRARPPVAYASCAPFPFLPAPSYDIV